MNVGVAIPTHSFPGDIRVFFFSSSGVVSEGDAGNAARAPPNPQGGGLSKVRGWPETGWGRGRGGMRGVQMQMVQIQRVQYLIGFKNPMGTKSCF